MTFCDGKASRYFSYRVSAGLELIERHVVEVDCDCGGGSKVLYGDENCGRSKAAGVTDRGDGVWRKAWLHGPSNASANNNSRRGTAAMV